MKIILSTAGQSVAPFLVIGSGIAGLYTALKLAEIDANNFNHQRYPGRK